MTDMTNREADEADLADTLFARDEKPEAVKAEPATEAPAEPVEAEAAQPEQQEEPDPKGPGRDEKGRFVPVSELVAERKRLQEARDAEARARAEAEARLRYYEEQQARARQQQVQQPAPPPDPYTDPEGFAAYQEQRFEMKLLNERANMSEMHARGRYGDQVVDTALQMAQRAGVAAHFARQVDPYGSLVQWARQEAYRHKVGPDPEAYENKIREETRNQILADLKAGKIRVDGTPVTQQQRYPGSLTTATAAGSQGAMLSDEVLANSLFNRSQR